MLLTVIVPVLNEKDHIATCLNSIIAATSELDAEILVLDGGSTDGTALILSEMRNQFPQIKLLHNPHKYQVHALNIGIGVAKGQYIVRCDAHSTYPRTYFSEILNYFRSDTDDQLGNIGIPYVTVNNADTPFNNGLGFAMSSPLGVGISHRTKANISETRQVDTLLFGAWRRSIFDEAGLFDEDFIRGQDYEHNLRIRGLGKKVMMIPGTPFKYYTRPSITKLSKMVFQYAYAKGQIIIKHRKLPNLRSLVPAAALLATPALAVAGFLQEAFIVYASLLSLESLRYMVKRRSTTGAAGVIVAIPTMHFSHALGLMVGLKDAIVYSGRQQRMNSTR